MSDGATEFDLLANLILMNYRRFRTWKIRAWYHTSSITRLGRRGKRGNRRHRHVLDAVPLGLIVDVVHQFHHNTSTSVRFFGTGTLGKKSGAALVEKYVSQGSQHLLCRRTTQRTERPALLCAASKATVIRSRFLHFGLARHDGGCTPKPRFICRWWNICPSPR